MNPQSTVLSATDTANGGVSSRQVAIAMLQDHVARLNHIEQLLLGLATLAIAGWGFFYATKSRPKTESEKTAAIGRVLFALVFSGLVGSAFNSLYIGRMGINRALLEIETYLAPEILPYVSFMKSTGVVPCLVVFGVPALFMPILALGAMAFSWLDARRSIAEERSQNLITLTALLCAVPVVSTTVISMISVFGMVFSFK